MNRIAGMVAAAFLTFIAGCSGGSVADDAEPPQGGLVIGSARLLNSTSTSEQILQMSVQSADADRLVGIEVGGPKGSKLTMYRSFEKPNTPAPLKANQAFPRPVEQITSVTLESKKPIAFGWDGYAAVLKSPGSLDPKSTMVQITLDFEKHEPVRLSVPVVSQ